MSERLKQIGSHVSGNYPKGMLAGEVAIITGEKDTQDLLDPSEHS